MSRLFFFSRQIFTLALFLVSSMTFAQDTRENIVTIGATFEQQTEDTAHLTIRANVKPGYHIYAMSQQRPFLKTEIHLEDSTDYEVLGEFKASKTPDVRQHETIPVELHWLEGEITWTAPVRLLTSEKSPAITGTVRAQACWDEGCLPPRNYAFSAELERTTAQETSVASTSVMQPESKTFSLDELKVDESQADQALPLHIFPIAFLAGLLLNFMPCVLPVIGLKVLSFVQQAGDNRRRIFALNAAYALGLLAVMWVLATLAVFAGIGWGEQFSSPTFNVLLASAVFVFALSFLGVWEIPIPGFVGTVGSKNQEGLTGAFSKGVLTTVLATPCSGPFLGSALTWAVTQPAYLTYAIFSLVGLGMASPYLLIGAYPRLIAFLPKPGAWMNTFKQVMGFILLGTVVYLLSFLTIPFVVPAVALFVGLAAACWWVGRISLSQPFARRMRSWAIGGGIVVASGLLSFGWLEGVMQERFERAIERRLATTQRESEVVSTEQPKTDGIAWSAFSRDRLETSLGEGKTVFVEFTADWCLTCKANEAAAINKDEVRDYLESHNIVALRADKTEPAPEIDETLKQLGNKASSIPFYAVFPADRPGEPILFDGILTSPQPVLDALQKAETTNLEANPSVAQN